MSIYNECDIINIPYKRIVDDVLTRSTLNYESFTPFRGMKDIFDKQLNSTLSNSEKELMLDEIEEFSILRSKASEDFEEDTYTADMGRVSVTSLENINESHVEKYVKNGVIGLKLRTKTEVFENAMLLQNQVIPLLKDKDTGTLKSISDIEPEYLEESSEDIELAKKRIPHLLKKIYEGSKVYKICLMSMLIAKNKILRNDRTIKSSRELKTRHFSKHAIWTIKADGSHNNMLNPETLGSSQNFMNVLPVIIGSDKDNPYFKATIELENCFLLLDIDIVEEDPLQYTKNVVDALVNHYCKTLSETINDSAYSISKFIANAYNGLNPAKEFDQMAKAVTSKPVYELVSHKMRLCEENGLYAHYDYFQEVDYSVIVSSLGYYYSLNCTSESIYPDVIFQKSSQYTLSGMFVCYPDGSPVVLDTTSVFSINGKRSLHLLTKYATLIKVDSKESTISTTSLILLLNRLSGEIAKPEDFMREVEV